MENFLESSKLSMFKLIVIIFILFISLFYYENIFAETENDEVYLAIIIDDFGNNAEGTKEFIESNIPFTAAIMPNLPASSSESKELNDKNKDIILHMPMEAKTGKKSWLGEVYLSSDMSTSDINQTLNTSLEQLEGVIGINNHMGSKAMEDERIMKELAKVASERNLIIVDSKTTANSPIHKFGAENNVRVLERDVFLDSTDDINTIEENLIKAGDIAKKQGYCIAIGHVGEDGGLVTYNAIINKKVELENMGVKLVTLRQLLELI